MLPRLLRGSVASPRRQYVKTCGWQRPGCSTDRRHLVTLAIETSCDDTSVAVAELPSIGPLKVHFHEKVTANNDAYSGIHPLVALHSHQVNLAPLVHKALAVSPRPDVIAATRGPGMRSNLAVGLDTAKGLALGLNVPFLGIHHMQAHALTPRLMAAMQANNGQDTLEPNFPFLTVLASGGHTMLINSTSLTEHTVLAETQDTALGDCLDKAARAVLPREALKPPYGKSLEDFAFPSGALDYDYVAPTRRQEELLRRKTRWNWGLAPPLADSKGGDKTSKRMVYTFAGVLSSVERFMKHKISPDGRLASEIRSAEEVTLEERREMAREVQRVTFEHVVSRILLHLATLDASAVSTIVVSGGVASNSYFRHVMRAMLDARKYGQIRIACPPPSLCTDNALMIAWAALEMWHAGYTCSLEVEPIRKWSMDPRAEDGGILGVGGWSRR
ncbi:peptidase M22, glycoprotease [Lecanosticta acicola]|uniref:N(6)-L-threonylcarbamoyladenine synthase n=1 Tax=Lecanosticta acicola TaxID=111012 RepID=A0AAI9ECV3_9PEZI|nr:peptidase M22, glycoprotease [Lecanosticta acicola]